jgi:5'-nucleotidase
LKEVLEQQFNNPSWVRVLSPSSGFRFGYDLSKPVGQRVVFATLNGVPIDNAKSYRVAVSDFLSNGGDLFSGFVSGTQPTVGPTDLEAFITLIGRPGLTALPMLDRIENLTP